MKSRDLIRLLGVAALFTSLVSGSCGSDSGGSGTGGTAGKSDAAAVGGTSGGAGGADSGEPAEDDRGSEEETWPPCASLNGTTCTGGVKSCMGQFQSAPCNCTAGKYVCLPFCGDPCAKGASPGQCYDANPTIAPVACTCRDTGGERGNWTCK